MEIIPILSMSMALSSPPKVPVEHRLERRCPRLIDPDFVLFCWVVPSLNRNEVSFTTRGEFPRCCTQRLVSIPRTATSGKRFGRMCLRSHGPDYVGFLQHFQRLSLRNRTDLLEREPSRAVRLLLSGRSPSPVREQFLSLGLCARGDFACGGKLRTVSSCVRRALVGAGLLGLYLDSAIPSEPPNFAVRGRGTGRRARFRWRPAMGRADEPGRLYVLDAGRIPGANSCARSPMAILDRMDDSGGAARTPRSMELRERDLIDSAIPPDSDLAPPPPMEQAGRACGGVVRRAGHIYKIVDRALCVQPRFLSTVGGPPNLDAWQHRQRLVVQHFP